MQGAFSAVSTVRCCGDTVLLGTENRPVALAAGGSFCALRASRRASEGPTHRCLAQGCSRFTCV